MIRPRGTTLLAVASVTTALGALALAISALSLNSAVTVASTPSARLDAARELIGVAERASVVVDGQRDVRASTRDSVEGLVRADVSSTRRLAAAAGLQVSTHPTGDEFRSLALAAADIVRASEVTERVAFLEAWSQRATSLGSLSILSLAAAIAIGVVSYRLSARERTQLLAAIPGSTPGASLPDRMAWLAGRERRARAVADTVWRESRSLDERLAESDERLRERERLLVEQGEEIRRTRHSSLQDPMTGLWRLEFFRAELRAALNRYEETGEPFAVLALDLDSFKRINDAHGHEGGNEAIRGAARLISETSPESAIVCRSGGDEFLVLLPGADLAAAEAAGSAIAEAVADAVIAYAIAGETRYIPLRTSVGAYATGASPREEILDGRNDEASLEDDLAIKSAIHRADDASKYAKIWARGRHVLWSRAVEERLATRRLPVEWDSFRRELETAYSVFEIADHAAFDKHYDILRNMVSDALRRAAEADGDSAERTNRQEVSR